MKFPINEQKTIRFREKPPFVLFASVERGIGFIYADRFALARDYFFEKSD